MSKQGVQKTSRIVGKLGRRDHGLNIHRLEFKRGFRGWAFWPEREDLAVEFARLLGGAQEGGSTVAECMATASLIDFSDDGSWYRAWTKAADSSDERASAALAKGNVGTARSNWLRAMNYYQAAALPFDPSDETYQTAIGKMRRCAHDHVSNGNRGGEVVLIPWLDGYPLEGYFLPAATAAGCRAPVVICMAEPGQRKEEYLFRAARYARERGLSLLAVDLFGADIGSRFDEVVGRRDLETTVGLVMDYLLERDDVDENRIVILSDQLQSSFVARGIAFDDRFAAAVCDGGLWDLNEREFLRERLARDDASIVVGPALSRVARSIKCPVLIPARRRGGLRPERVQELVDWLRAGGRDVTLEIFGDGEPTALGQADNPTLASEFIFDWIEARLATLRH
jgi:hypothetical protein